MKDIFSSITKGDLQTVKEILFSNPNIVSQRNDEGKTPAEHAHDQNQWKAFSLLKEVENRLGLNDQIAKDTLRRGKFRYEGARLVEQVDPISVKWADVVLGVLVVIVVAVGIYFVQNPISTGGTGEAGQNTASGTDLLANAGDSLPPPPRRTRRRSLFDATASAFQPSSSASRAFLEGVASVPQEVPISSIPMTPTELTDRVRATLVELSPAVTEPFSFTREPPGSYLLDGARWYGEVLH